MLLLLVAATTRGSGRSARWSSVAGGGGGGATTTTTTTTTRLFGGGNKETNDNNLLITSTKSATVRRILAVMNKRRKRVELGETVAEGSRIVFDLLSAEGTRPLVQQVLVSTDRWSDYEPTLSQYPHVQPVLQVTPSVLRACSDTVTNQGILALCRIPDYTLEDAAASSTDNNNNSAAPLYLVLDGVSDPGNAGTLVRSAAAAGVKAVLLLPGTCDPWNPKAVRSAAAASFQLPVVTAPSWSACVRDLAAIGCTEIYAATMLQGDDDDETSFSSRAYYDIDWTAPHPTALVIGSEGNGLTAQVRKALAQQQIQAVHVPMVSQSVESLNAAVTGSIILFEAYRQKHQERNK
jgi:TrmH family RNA methyltransferase